jgi:tetratricopeptide (TPR) repeat protein
MGKAQDPDSRIKAAEALLGGFPDTDYKAVALQVEADSYHQKSDVTKAIVLAEQSLEADPKSFYTLLLLAEIYSQNTRSTDLDMGDRLAKVDTFAKDAISLLAAAEKPDPKVSDADWTGIKRGEESRAWEAMGLAAIIRNKPDEAKTDLQKSMDLYSTPTEMLRIARAYAAANRFDEAIGWDDKAADSPNADDTIKRIAASDKTRAQSMKKQQ